MAKFGFFFKSFKKDLHFVWDTFKFRLLAYDFTPPVNTFQGSDMPAPPGNTVRALTRLLSCQHISGLRHAPRSRKVKFIKEYHFSDGKY